MFPTGYKAVKRRTQLLETGDHPGLKDCKDRDLAVFTVLAAGCGVEFQDYAAVRKYARTVMFVAFFGTAGA